MIAGTTTAPAEQQTILLDAELRYLEHIDATPDGSLSPSNVRYLAAVVRRVDELCPDLIRTAHAAGVRKGRAQATRELMTPVRQRMRPLWWERLPDEYRWVVWAPAVVALVLAYWIAVLVAPGRS